VVDECHRGIYGEYRRALDHFDAVKVGLTATPLVGRPPEDADPDDLAFVRDTLRFFEVAEPTFRYTLEEAIDEGHLVPYRIYRAHTVKTAASGGFEVRRDEIDWAALDPAAREALGEASAARTRSPSIPPPWSGCSPSPSATAPWCASSATCWSTATPAPTACAGRPTAARRSSSR
jgi:hypothetical protein